MQSITRATRAEYVVELLGVAPSRLLTQSVISQFDKDFGYFRAGFEAGGRSV